MSVFSGDFLGFQLGKVHSSQLNITRVSNGDRYSEGLTPSFNDSIVQTPGGDGTYYWDTFYSQKTFTIDFAFDDLREEDIRKLKQVFSFKGIQPLIFDETPYKKYLVKCSSPPTLKYIGFGQNGIVVYKGEGSVNLVAYYPYAISTSNIDLSFTGEDNTVLNIYCNNIGDIPAPFKMIYGVGDPKSSIETEKTNLATVVKKILIQGAGELKFNITENDINKDNLGQIIDKYICIDMRTHLIEGLDENFKKTGYLYNYCITGGDFFELPLGNSKIEHKNSSNSSVYYNYNGSTSAPKRTNDYVKCEFNYLYY